MAASLVGGAAVGAVFGELLKAVLEIRGKAGMFKQTFNYLQFTLVAIKPVIQEMEQQNDDLGRPKEELEWLIKEMEKGTKLVRKCSEINRINYVAKVRYQYQLEEFIDSLVRFFTINMQAYTSRDQKETLLKVNRILSTVNKLPLVNPEDTAGSSSYSITVSESDIYDENAVETNCTEEAMENISQLTRNSSWGSDSVYFSACEDESDIPHSPTQSAENAAGTNSTEQALVPPTSIAHESISKAENNQGMEHLMNEKPHEQPGKIKMSGLCLPNIVPFNREVKKATPEKHGVFCIACGICDPYCIQCYFKQFPPYRLDCSYSSSFASVELIGKGSYGETYKAILKDGREVAVKKLRNVVEKSKFEEQVKIVQTLISEHPNVIPIRAYYYGRDEKLLIYDYIMPGSLYSLSHVLRWNFIMGIAHGAAVGIAHIHSAGMVHGNITSSNILVTIDKMDNVQGCISDFGLNHLTHDSVNPSRNKGYRAPELADNTGELTQKCDVYSFGVLLSEMLTGRSVARNKGQVPNLDHLRDSDAENPVRRRQEPKMVELASKCVAMMPDLRPSMAEVVEEIKKSKRI